MKKLLTLIITVMTVAMIFASCGGTETHEAAAPDDGQNPVMNFVGRYGCGRATADVEAVGSDGIKVTVTWAGSASENSEWIMSGTFDDEDLRFEYTDCVKTNRVYNESGEVDSEEVVYSDGRGSIQFTDDPLAFTWQDDMENAAEDMVFGFAS